MSDVQKTDYELPDNKWLQSHYTYVGNVFDTPEHQEALSKLKTVKEQIAYKDKILKQQREEYLNHN